MPSAAPSVGERAGEHEPRAACRAGRGARRHHQRSHGREGQPAMRRAPSWSRARQSCAEGYTGRARPGCSATGSSGIVRAGIAASTLAGGALPCWCTGLRGVSAPAPFQVDAMPPLPPRPRIYEINTAVWLRELSAPHGRPVTLATVPESVWDAIAALGVDAVWLMGVWERSPAGRAVALGNPGARRGLPARAARTWPTPTCVGSPYCVRRYVVDAAPRRPGGSGRRAGGAGERGLRLILDFVPNHVAPRPPVGRRSTPSASSRGSDDDLAREPGLVPARGDRVIACGRDPYFPAWPDVAQLNAFSAAAARGRASTRSATIAEQCDGVRCDMAMLLINDVFARTWGERAGPRPADEFWPSDRRRDGARTRTSASSPRPTGTSSGRCSSRASTTATTSGSTTGCVHDDGRRRRGAPAGRHAPTRSGWSASSRTTTSRAPPPRSGPSGRGRPRRRSCSRARRARCSTRASSKAAACACRCSSAPARRGARRGRRARSTRRSCATARHPLFRDGRWRPAPVAGGRDERLARAGPACVGVGLRRPPAGSSSSTWQESGPPGA